MHSPSLRAHPCLKQARNTNHPLYSEAECSYTTQLPVLCLFFSPLMPPLPSSAPPSLPPPPTRHTLCSLSLICLRTRSLVALCQLCVEHQTTCCVFLCPSYKPSEGVPPRQAQAGLGVLGACECFAPHQAQANFGMLAATGRKSPAAQQLPC